MVTTELKTNGLPNNGVRPLLSTHDIDSFQKRQEHEAVLDLRRRAITRWLKQLPSDEEDRNQHTMWASFQSLGITDNCSDLTGHEHESCELGGYDFEEESPIDSMEKKSMPSDVDECPIRGLQSMKRNELWVQKSLSEAISFHDGVRHSGRYSEKYVTKHETGHVTEKEGSDTGWSAMSDCMGDPIQNEDTAYSSSSNGTGKNGDGKGQCPSFVCDPPHSQTIQPRSSSFRREFLPPDIKSGGEIYTADVPEGEWWMPNVFFKGLANRLDMFVQVTANSTPYVDAANRIPAAIPSAMRRRLALRRVLSRTRRTHRSRYPSLSRLQLRMHHAKRNGNTHYATYPCVLLHPPEMKSMIPCTQQSPHVLHPPQQIRAMDYRPPSSIADLSDFECYVGPVLSAFMERSHPEHPAVAGQCQTWLLEKLLCFLGGRATYT